MRVIHLLRKYDPAEWGGTEIAVQRLFDGLRQHDVTPILYCPQLPTPRSQSDVSGGSEPGLCARNPGRAPAGLRDSGGQTVKRFRACVPVSGISPEQRRQLIALGGNLMSFDLMPALWREPDIALIHTHTLGRLGGIASAVARGRRLPFVVSIHGGLFDLPPVVRDDLNTPARHGFEWGKIFGLLLQSRRLLGRADAVFACNHTEAGHLRNHYPGKRIEVQPHGIQTALYEADQRAAARGAFPQIVGRDVLLCAGRIDPVKNQEWLVLQAPELFRNHPKALLVLAGPCTNEAYGRSLARQIRYLGLEHRVLLTGGLPPGDSRLVGLFQESRAMVLPSLSETFGLVLVEAWAAGTTVISSRTSGASALIRDGENGWLFDFSDPSTFHQAVSQTLLNPGLREQLAGAGRRKANSEYDLPLIAGRVKRLYEELIEDKHALRHSA